MVEWKKLGEVCQVLNGFAFKSSEYVPKGIRIIRISDVQNGYISDKDKVFYPIEKLSEFERYLLNNGDLVMSLTGNPGRVAFIRNESCALNQRVACLRAKTVSNSYLFYLFNCKEFESTAFANSTGGAQKNLSTTWLNNFPIPIPSLSEQTRIVGILDTFTASIDNLKEQIAQRRKQYEYYRDQLLDLEGKEGVEIKYITEVAKSYTGLTYKPENVSDSGTLVLRSSNINDDVLSFDDNIFVQMVIPERAIVQENDILICVRNGSKRLVGKSAMITKEAEGMAFGAFMTILRSFAINSKFLFYVWQSEKVRRQYKGDEAMPIAQITAKDFQRIVIPVPSLSEQQRIVTILDTFESSIQNLEAQLSQREKQYEYYRNKLLTFE